MKQVSLKTDSTLGNDSLPIISFDAEKIQIINFSVYEFLFKSEMLIDSCVIQKPEIVFTPPQKVSKRLNKSPQNYFLLLSIH